MLFCLFVCFLLDELARLSHLISDVANERTPHLVVLLELVPVLELPWHGR